MKRSSQTGFFGVERLRGQFCAFHQRGADRKLLGEFQTAEEAARKYDAYLVDLKGAVRAFDSGLNYPEDYRAEYNDAQTEVAEKARQEAAALEAELREVPFPAERHSELLDKFRTGLPIKVLAQTFGVHVDVIIGTLQRLESERLRSIGLTVPVAAPVSKHTLRDHVSISQKAGESVRSIADRLGVDRKTITAWLRQEQQ